MKCYVDSDFKLLHLSSQKSAIEQDIIVVDEDTKNMLEAMGFKDLPGTQVAAPAPAARA